MDKIGLISLNTNIKTNNENNLFSKSGQTIQAIVLNNTQNGLLLKIGNTVVNAQTDYRFPKDTQLSLTVVSLTDDKIMLSLKNDSNYYSLNVLDILQKLNLGDSPEIRIIINKMIEKRLKISKENIESIRQLVENLPLEVKDSINILTDPTLCLAFFTLFEQESGFSFLLNQNENIDNKHSYFEINILFNSINLGDILINVIWWEKVDIQFICALKSGYSLLESNLSMLKSILKSHNITTGECKIILDDAFLKEKEAINDYQTQLKGIDVRI
ncbi:MAG: hypothetical protein JM58_03840 [Peptococcaceae bacterium BICA1-8]|nr:MAG: hypothetical protein JM58_03840 [Peptococcaceae bacterium BICA1-8]